MTAATATATTATPDVAQTYLSINNIEVIYDHVILVLKGVSLEVPQGRIVALLGANGAGKTTTLKAISNLLRAERGDVTKGTIEFKGRRVDRLTPSELVKLGICQVMEGRHCFQHLTVEENLLTGAFTRSASRAEIRTDLEKVYNYFPRLKQRRTSLAGYTSGGEQQMTAIGRALMAQPSMILLDEPSMGLAPQIVEEIFEIVGELNRKEGVSFLLAEQNTMVALRHAHYGYILENGRVVMDGAAADLAAINSRDALARLPVIRKSQLGKLQKQARPFGGLAATKWGSARRVFASPGPIYEPEGAAPDYWRLGRALFAAGFRAGDLVHNAVSYHLTPGASMLETGAHALGCTVFRAGTGQTELQVQAIAELRPDAYVGTPSFFKIILDKADEQAMQRASLKKALVSGEAFPPSLRDALAARGIVTYQAYATADVGSIAYESEAREGLIVDEGVLVEIVRPGTGEPLAP